MSKKQFEDAAKDILAGLAKQHEDAQRQANDARERDDIAKAKAAKREAPYTTIINFVTKAMEELRDTLTQVRSVQVSISRNPKNVRLNRRDLPSLVYMTIQRDAGPDFGRPRHLLPAAEFGLARGDVGEPCKDMLIIYYTHGGRIIEYHAEIAIDPNVASVTQSDVTTSVLNASRKAYGHS